MRRFKIDGPEISPGHPMLDDSSLLHILLVEDHTATRVALSIWLTDLGHDVLIAESVSDALIAAEGKNFDVVVTDIELPDGNGRDLVRRLHRTHKFRGVGVSGTVTGPVERDLSRQAGFAVHLEKPFTIEELKSALW